MSSKRNRHFVRREDAKRASENLEIKKGEREKFGIKKEGEKENEFMNLFVESIFSMILVTHPTSTLKGILADS